MSETSASAKAQGEPATPAPAQILLNLQQVEHGYGTGPAVVGPLDLQVNRGELLVLSGPANCGKSVLMRLLAGLELPRQGSLTVGGENLARLRGAGRAQLRRSLGVLVSGADLLDDADALDNAAVPALVAGHARVEARSRAKAALTLLGWTEASPWGRAVRDLAQGERQQVAIARALVNRPALLLLDDLYDRLDDLRAAQALAAVEQYCAAGVGAVIFHRAVTPAQPPRAGLVWPERTRHVWLGHEGASA